MNASRTCAWIATAVLGLACGGGSSEPEPVPPLTIGTASLPGGTVGTPYTAALTASGGTAPYQWSLASGSLPSGLDLGEGGVISGTPTAAGTSSFTVRVTDAASSSRTATRALSITVAPSTLTVTTTSLPEGTTGAAYSQAIAVSGGIAPYAFEVYQPAVNGDLPRGLSLHPDTGVISGIPTTQGTFFFMVHVADHSLPAQHAYASLAIEVQAELMFFYALDAENSAIGRELWRTDGTAAGTVLLFDINAGAGESRPSVPRDFAKIGGGACFGADDGVNGYELWRTDGTAAGTAMVRDINPGAGGSIPGYFAVFGGACAHAFHSPRWDDAAPRVPSSTWALLRRCESRQGWRACSGSPS